MKLFPAQTEQQTEVLRRLGRTSFFLLLLFSYPLVKWAAFALRSEFHSHVLLVPFVSFYLVRISALDGLWQPAPHQGRVSLWTLVWSGLGILAAGGYISSLVVEVPLRGSDALALSSLSFLCCFYAVVCGCLSAESVRQIVFPLGFLCFFIPLPGFAMDGIEVFLQHASAEAASWLFNLSGLPFLRDQLTFALPGITIKVAQECSGVRSSLVLFMTSLIAGFMFLRRPGHRWTLAALTIFLGILRNAFRITVIAWLCVEIGPDMIHSVIHKRGGPLFFAVSLVPLGLILWFMIRRERQSAEPSAGRTSEPPALLSSEGRTKIRRV